MKLLIFFLTLSIGTLRVNQALHIIGDYLELKSTLQNCKPFPSSELSRFDRCVFDAAISRSNVQSFSDVVIALCTNQQSYLKCWKPIVKKAKSCNTGAPAVYKGTIMAMCGNDNGLTAREQVARAEEEVPTEKGCSASKEPWADACKDLLNDMTSNNVCKKHKALYQCSDRIICKEQPMGRLLMRWYKEAGTKLGCK